jgi:hypothetical protein
MLRALGPEPQANCWPEQPPTAPVVDIWSIDRGHPARRMQVRARLPDTLPSNMRHPKGCTVLHRCITSYPSSCSYGVNRAVFRLTPPGSAQPHGAGGLAGVPRLVARCAASAGSVTAWQLCCGNRDVNCFAHTVACQGCVALHARSGPHLGIATGGSTTGPAVAPGPAAAATVPLGS